MDDHSHVEIKFFDCPPSQAGRVLQFLDEHRLRLDEYETRDWGVNADELVLGMPYACEALPVGFGDDLARLALAAPSVTFSAAQSPAYEERGELLLHVPDLGLFRAGTDGGGRMIWDQSEIAAFLAQHRDTPDPLAALSVAFGQPWCDHILHLKKSAIGGHRVKALPGTGPATGRSRRDPHV